MTDEKKAKKIAEYLNQPNGSNSLLQCYQAAMIMAEWKAEQMIKKASKWLSNFYSEERHCFLVKEDIEAFEKAMEE